MDEPNNIKVWILCDHHDGSNSQCIGIAQKLCNDYGTINQADLQGRKLDEFVKKEILGAPKSQRTVLISANPEVRDTAIRIKSLAGDRLFNVHLCSTRASEARSFDLQAFCEAPSMPLSVMKDRILPNLVGIAHKITPEKIEQGKQEWEQQFSGLQKPVIALIVGGDVTPTHHFTAAMAKKLGREVNEYAKRNHASLIVTNSRRTSPEATQALSEEITVPCYMYDKHKNPENPYFGILGIADAFIVTGDSLSLMCEACSTGKPVYCYPLQHIEMPMHGFVQHQLVNTGRIHSFEAKGTLENWSYEPLDIAGEIADAIRERINIISKQTALG